MLGKACLPQILKLVILIFFTVLLFSGTTIAQENVAEQSPESTQIISETIAIKDISAESERLRQRIFQLRSILAPSTKIQEVDSLISNTSAEIQVKKDSLFARIGDLNQRTLKVQMVEWENYRLSLAEYKNVLNTRLTIVAGANDELVDEINKWKLTKENLVGDDDSTHIYSNVDTLITNLQGIMQVSLVRLDSIFVIQKGLTGLIIDVDEVISEINRIELQLQKAYFVFDSPALWHYHRADLLETDSVKAPVVSIANSLESVLVENYLELRFFLESRLNILIFQLIFILLLLALMFVVKGKWKKDIDNLDDSVKKDVKVILYHPIFATLAVGPLISFYFYKSTIPIFGEITVLIILAATVVLLPKLTTKRFSIFLILLYISYILYLLEVHMVSHAFFVRILLLLNTIILIISLIYGYLEVRNNREKFSQIRSVFKAVIPLYILCLVLIVIANLIGMVSLSQFLFQAVLYSTSLGIVIFLSVKVFTSIFVFLFKLKSSSNIQTLSIMINVTQRRIKPILLLIGLAVWAVFTLMSFELYEYLVEYIRELLKIEWNVGEMVISLGGILGFLFIFIVALLLSKLGGTIFQDDWIVKTLPRGIAPAISLLLRIIIITIGLYVGLSAAGLDLGKLGFIFGALGVGIGFGLQTVVLNFIAGLILAFERPINLGDTIEVEQEMGVVTSIGVRSSNIRTYSGSEAIIPNGSLISKKVINWTLSNRDRRSKIIIKTSGSANPNTVLELFTKIASEHPNVYKKPAPIAHFHGFNKDGNIDFALYFWTTFSETWNTEPQVALKIYNKLNEAGIQAPIPVVRIVSENKVETDS